MPVAERPAPLLGPLMDRLCGRLAGLAAALLPALALAGEPCRIAFDMGSSGIRAGASNSALTRRVEINYLEPLWAGRGLEEKVAPTIAALRELPEQSGFGADCARVGGGFSAWRLALRQDPQKLAADLARIRAASGVAVLVVPQATEGAYGYFGARQALGGRLTTSHVLDIGGGSLQIAGARRSYGAALGQQAWQRLLCQALRGTSSVPCALAPLGEAELVRARALLAEQLAGVKAALPGALTLTAISRPVARGVLPAVRRFGAGAEADQAGFTRRALSTAIERIAPLAPEASAALLETSPRYAAFLLSDLLLVEGLLRASGVGYLQVTEIDLTNLPGLLADERAFRWRTHHDCYLARLRRLGEAAYASDPSSCPAGPPGAAGP